MGTCQSGHQNVGQSDLLADIDRGGKSEISDKTEQENVKKQQQ